MFMEELMREFSRAKKNIKRADKSINKASVSLGVAPMKSLSRKRKIAKETEKDDMGQRS